MGYPPMDGSLMNVMPKELLADLAPNIFAMAGLSFFSCASAPLAASHPYKVFWSTAIFTTVASLDASRFMCKHVSLPLLSMSK